MIDKRGLLRGMVGGALIGKRAAAATLQQGYPTQTPLADAMERGAYPVSPSQGIDPFWQAKTLFLQKAEEEGDKMRAKIHRQMDALNDIYSPSAAYRRSRVRDLQNQLEEINARLRLLRSTVY